MKVLNWLGDRTVAKVVGVYHQLGENCEKLITLSKAGWTIAGESKFTPEDGNDADIFTINSSGILTPEPDNPIDKEAVAVYLKFVLKKDSNLKPSRQIPERFALKIGYLPKDSILKQHIKYPTRVNIRCRTISEGKNYFQAEIIGIPTALTPEGIKNNTFDLNID